MKKKKVSEKENKWKGVLQEDSKPTYLIPSNSRTPLECEVNSNLDELPKETKVVNFYQVGESNVTPDNFIVTSTNSNIDKPLKIKMESNSKLGYDEEDVKKIKILEWENFTKDKTLNREEEHCNVGVNKDWNFTKEELDKLNDDWLKNLGNYKQKRIDFEFTPLTFWQLFPSIAVNLHSNEIESTWLCFGMYIKFK